MTAAKPIDPVPEIQNPNSKIQNPRDRLAQAIDLCVQRLRQKLEDPDLPTDQLCKIGDTLAKFAREDNAADRITASVQVARLRARSTARGPASLRIADDRARFGQAAERPSFRYEPTAPWGRKPDGTAHTQAEFNAHLKRAMSEIYGINMTDDHFKPYPIAGGTLDLQTGHITPHSESGTPQVGRVSKPDNSDDGDTTRITRPDKLSEPSRASRPSRTDPKEPHDSDPQPFQPLPGGVKPSGEPPTGPGKCSPVASDIKAPSTGRPVSGP
jgi:hypothetical protein